MPTKAFGINACSQAFEILSAKIYTNVPLAVVRELSTNASDAHVEAGNGARPFDVHLPNALEPWFAIRDYGTGLSPESVSEIYSVYFASTRNESNDFTGCMGLGSKSPFAYTDQFTIVSYFKGIKYNFSAYKGEDGAPTISLLGQVPTDEENGVEIKINVNSYDFHGFHESAEAVYRWFAVRPNITGKEIVFAEHTPAVSGQGYELYSGDRYSLGMKTDISVVMGQVCYQVDNSYFDSRLGRGGMLVLHVPLGDCSIAASREELHYDDKTKTAIQTRIDAALNDAETQLKSEIDTSAPKLNQLQQESKWQNLVRSNQQTNAWGYATISLYEKDKYSGRSIGVSYSSRLRIGMWRDRISVNFNTHYIFIEDDVDELTQKWKTRLKIWLKENGAGKEVHLVNIEDHAAFAETFGPIAVKVSTLPKPPRKQPSGVNAGAGAPREYIKELVASRNLTECWISPGDDIDTDACVIPKDGHRVIWRGHKCHPKDIAGFAKTAGFTKVYGITQSRFKKLQAKLGLPSLEEKAKAYIENYAKSLTDHQKAKHNHGSAFRGGSFTSKIAGISDICDEYITFTQAKGIGTGHTALMKAFDIKVGSSRNYENELIGRYPMLEHVRTTHDSMNDVINYMKMVEENQK